MVEREIFIILINGICLGFHMMNVKLRRIFLPVEAENVFFFSPEFSINTFYKTDQGPFALPRDEFLHE